VIVSEAEPVVKKARIEGDVPVELVREIVATITEPEEMVGPDVCLSFIII